LQFADILSSIARRKALAAAIFAVCASVLAVFLFTRQEVRGEDRYKASTQLLVPFRGEGGTFPEDVPPSLLFGQGDIASSDSTAIATFDQAGVPEDERDDIELDFSRSERGDILTLSATADDSDLAVAVRDAYVEEFVASRRSIAADYAAGSRDSARRSLDPLTQRLAEVEAALRQIDPDLLGVVGSTAVEEGRAVSTIDLEPGTPLDVVLLVYERNALLNSILSTQIAFAERSAESLVPQSHATVLERIAPEQIVPELPSPVLPSVVLLGGGLFLAALVPVLLDRADRSIREPADAAEALRAPVLATLPATRKLASLAPAGSPSAAAYRALAVTSVATDRLPSALLVTAPTGRAQDSVAANMAASLAALGVKVALIATDPRHSWFLDASGAVITETPATLPDLLELAHAEQLDDQLLKRLVPTSIDNLLLVPPGKVAFEGTLDALPTLLAGLEEAGIDITLIAASAILEDPNATIVGWSTRSVLWVVRSGQVAEADALEAASRTELAGIAPFGVAFIDGG
jgi:capsular polysaccharide biosynthesis protein